MKILKAKNYLSEIKIPIQLFDVQSLITIPPDNWLENRVKEFGYFDSFEKAGMLYPIVVTDETEQWVIERILPKNPQHKDTNNKLKKGLYVHLGNKRALWAKEKGYEKIEGYFVKEKKDKELIKSLTHIKHTRIPK
jgi:hypothetical protein